MGLLTLGTPLHWDEAKQFADYVREHGITQLLNIFHAVKDRVNDSLLWGDEACWRGTGLAFTLHRSSISWWSLTPSTRRPRCRLCLHCAHGIG